MDDVVDVVVVGDQAVAVAAWKVHSVVLQIIVVEEEVAEEDVEAPLVWGQAFVGIDDEDVADVGAV